MILLIMVITVMAVFRIRFFGFSACFSAYAFTIFTAFSKERFLI